MAHGTDPHFGKFNEQQVRLKWRQEMLGVGDGCHSAKPKFEVNNGGGILFLMISIPFNMKTQ